MFREEIMQDQRLYEQLKRNQKNKILVITHEIVIKAFTLQFMSCDQKSEITVKDEFDLIGARGFENCEVYPHHIQLPLEFESFNRKDSRNNIYKFTSPNNMETNNLGHS